MELHHIKEAYADMKEYWMKCWFLSKFMSMQDVLRWDSVTAVFLHIIHIFYYVLSFSLSYFLKPFKIGTYFIFIKTATVVLLQSHSITILFQV